jgi:hypothetical protein
VLAHLRDIELIEQQTRRFQRLIVAWDAGAIDQRTFVADRDAGLCEGTPAPAKRYPQNY